MTELYATLSFEPAAAAAPAQSTDRSCVSGFAFVPPVYPRIRKPGARYVPPVPTNTVAQSVDLPSLVVRTAGVPAVACIALHAPVSFVIAMSTCSPPAAASTFVATAVQAPPLDRRGRRAQVLGGHDVAAAGQQQGRRDGEAQRPPRDHPSPSSLTGCPRRRAAGSLVSLLVTSQYLAGVAVPPSTAFTVFSWPLCDTVVKYV